VAGEGRAKKKDEQERRRGGKVSTSVMVETHKPLHPCYREALGAVCGVERGQGRGGGRRCGRVCGAGTAGWIHGEDGGWSRGGMVDREVERVGDLWSGEGSERERQRDNDDAIEGMWVAGGRKCSWTGEGEV
jgi:hypothetical protein